MDAVRKIDTFMPESIDKAQAAFEHFQDESFLKAMDLFRRLNGVGNSLVEEYIDAIRNRLFSRILASGVWGIIAGENAYDKAVQTVLMFCMITAMKIALWGNVHLFRKASVKPDEAGRLRFFMNAAGIDRVCQQIQKEGVKPDRWLLDKIPELAEVLRDLKNTKE